MTARADVAVIGAGVVGLGVARALSLVGREVFVMEAERWVGFHTSSRNSEVVHAGIYYPPGSLKARFCVAGRRALYDYCLARGVKHARVGKVIVAVSDQEIPVLERLKATAELNGVRDLSWLTAAQARSLEPAVACVRALFSPSTGIVDSHGLLGALREDATRAGAVVALRTPVLSGRVEDDGIDLLLGGEDPATIRFSAVVNCAGPWAQTVAHRMEGFPARAIPAQHFARGHYFVLSGHSPFRHLVYPVPVPGGLGTHLTLDLAGAARFGPDVQWVERVDYRFDEDRAGAFLESIRRWYPGLAEARLQPGYTGVRAKLSGPGEPPADFLVQGPADHGVPGLVHLYGIESPGLTAVLALADHVLELLGAAGSGVRSSPG